MRFPVAHHLWWLEAYVASSWKTVKAGGIALFWGDSASFNTFGTWEKVYLDEMGQPTTGCQRTDGHTKCGVQYAGESLRDRAEHECRWGGGAAFGAGGVFWVIK